MDFERERDMARAWAREAERADAAEAERDRYRDLLSEAWDVIPDGYTVLLGRISEALGLSESEERPAGFEPIVTLPSGEFDADGLRIDEYRESSED